MRRVTILTLFALALASCEKPNTKLSSLCPVWWEPPAKYDYVPNPYPIERDLDKWDVNKACSGHYADGGTRIWGCALIVTLPAMKMGTYVVPAKSYPEIIVPKQDSGINAYCQQQIIRHEWGHINHWPDTHPDAVRAS